MKEALSNVVIIGIAILLALAVHLSLQSVLTVGDKEEGGASLGGKVLGVQQSGREVCTHVFNSGSDPLRFTSFSVVGEDFVTSGEVDVTIPPGEDEIICVTVFPPEKGTYTLTLSGDTVIKRSVTLDTATDNPPFLSVIYAPSYPSPDESILVNVEALDDYSVTRVEVNILDPSSTVISSRVCEGTSSSLSCDVNFIPPTEGDYVVRVLALDDLDQESLSSLVIPVRTARIYSVSFTHGLSFSPPNPGRYASILFHGDHNTAIFDINASPGEFNLSSTCSEAIISFVADGNSITRVEMNLTQAGDVCTFRITKGNTVLWEKNIPVYYLLTCTTSTECRDDLLLADTLKNTAPVVVLLSNDLSSTLSISITSDTQWRVILDGNGHRITSTTIGIALNKTPRYRIVIRNIEVNASPAISFSTTGTYTNAEINIEDSNLLSPLSTISGQVNRLTLSRTSVSGSSRALGDLFYNTLILLDTNITSDYGHLYKPADYAHNSFCIVNGKKYPVLTFESDTLFEINLENNFICALLIKAPTIRIYGGVIGEDTNATPLVTTSPLALLSITTRAELNNTTVRGSLSITAPEVRITNSSFKSSTSPNPLLSLFAGDVKIERSTLSNKITSTSTFALYIRFDYLPRRLSIVSSRITSERGYGLSIENATEVNIINTEINTYLYPINLTLVYPSTLLIADSNIFGTVNFSSVSSTATLHTLRSIIGNISISSYPVSIRLEDTNLLFPPYVNGIRSVYSSRLEANNSYCHYQGSYYPLYTFTNVNNLSLDVNGTACMVYAENSSLQLLNTLMYLINISLVAKNSEINIIDSTITGLDISDSNIYLRNSRINKSTLLYGTSNILKMENSSAEYVYVYSTKAKMNVVDSNITPVTNTSYYPIYGSNSSLVDINIISNSYTKICGRDPIFNITQGSITCSGVGTLVTEVNSLPAGSSVTVNCPVTTTPCP